jgi:YCII-related domain
MASYALLFRGGKLRSELTQEYTDRFAQWTRRVASNKEAPGNRFKQEGRLVSVNRVDTLKFDKDMVGGYIIIEADDYEGAAAVAKDCPILENNGSVESKRDTIINFLLKSLRYFQIPPKDFTGIVIQSNSFNNDGGNRYSTRRENGQNYRWPYLRY